MNRHFKKFGKYYLGVALVATSFIAIPTTVVATLFTGGSDTEHFLSDNVSFNYEKFANATNQSWVAINNMDNDTLVKNINDHMHTNGKLNVELALNSLDNIGNIGNTAAQKKQALTNIINNINFTVKKNEKQSNDSSQVTYNGFVSESSKDHSSINMKITLNENYITTNGEGVVNDQSPRNPLTPIKSTIGNVEIDVNKLMHQLNWTNEQYLANLHKPNTEPASIYGELTTLINSNEIIDVLSSDATIDGKDATQTEIKTIDNLKVKVGTSVNVSFDVILNNHYSFANNTYISNFSQTLNGNVTQTIDASNEAFNFVAFVGAGYVKDTDSINTIASKINNMSAGDLSTYFTGIDQNLFRVAVNTVKAKATNNRNIDITLTLKDGYVFSNNNKDVYTFTTVIPPPVPPTPTITTVNDNVVKLEANTILSQLGQTSWNNVHKENVNSFVNDFNGKDLDSKASIVSSDASLFNKAVKSYNIVLNNDKTISETISLNPNYVFNNNTVNATFIVDTPYANTPIPKVLVKDNDVKLTQDTIASQIGKTWDNIRQSDVTNFVNSFSNKSIAEMSTIINPSNPAFFDGAVNAYTIKFSGKKQLVETIGLNSGYEFSDGSSFTQLFVDVPFTPAPPTIVIVNDAAVKLEGDTILTQLGKTDWNDVHKNDVTSFVKDFNGKDLASKANIVSNDIPLFNKAVKSYNIILNDNKTITETISLNPNYAFDNNTTNKTINIDVKYADDDQKIDVTNEAFDFDGFVSAGYAKDTDSINTIISKVNSMSASALSTCFTGMKQDLFGLAVNNVKATAANNRDINMTLTLNKGYLFSNNNKNIYTFTTTIPAPIPPTPTIITVSDSVVKLEANTVLNQIDQPSWNNVHKDDVTSFVNDFNGKDLASRAKIVSNDVVLFNKAVKSYNIVLNNDKTITEKISLNPNYVFNNKTANTTFNVEVPYAVTPTPDPKTKVDVSDFEISSNAFLTYIGKNSWNDVDQALITSKITTFNALPPPNKAQIINPNDFSIMSEIQTYTITLNANNKTISAYVKLNDNYEFHNLSNHATLPPVSVPYKDVAPPSVTISTKDVTIDKSKFKSFRKDATGKAASNWWNGGDATQVGEYLTSNNLWYNVVNTSLSKAQFNSMVKSINVTNDDYNVKPTFVIDLNNGYTFMDTKTNSFSMSFKLN